MWRNTPEQQRVVDEIKRAPEPVAKGDTCNGCGRERPRWERWVWTYEVIGGKSVAVAVHCRACASEVRP